MEQHQLISKPAELAEEPDFKPRGAIAFLVALILLDIIIWYAIYFIMLYRS